MKKCILWLAVLIVFLIPIIQWGNNVFVSDKLINYQLPPGQWFYLLSKLMAQYAFLFLTVQLILGLLLADRPNWFSWLSIKVHRSIGLIALVTTLLHAGLFVAAVGIRSGHFPSKLLEIKLDQGFYNLYVSFGVIAASLLILVAIIGLFRGLLPVLFFRYAHRLAWLVWLFGFVHSYAIGTETGGWLVWSWFYLLAGGLVGLLLIYRIISIIYRARFKKSIAI